MRVSYVKVAEYQRRGALHFHVLVRLDRRNRTRPRGRAAGGASSRPSCSSDAVRGRRRARLGALPRSATIGGSRPRPARETIRWGAQIEVRALDTPARAGEAARQRGLHRQVRDQVHRGRRRADAPRSTPRTCDRSRSARTSRRLRRVRVAARRRAAPAASCGCGAGRTRSGSAGTASPRAAATRRRSRGCARRATSTQLRRQHGGEPRDPWGRPVSERASWSGAAGRWPGSAIARWATRGSPNRARSAGASSGASRARSFAPARRGWWREVRFDQTEAAVSGQAQVRESYVTAREVAERVGLSPDTILRYYREGRIPGRRMPGRSGRCASCGARSRRRGTASPTRRPRRRGVSGPSGSEVGRRELAARTDLPQADRAVGDPLPRRRAAPAASGRASAPRRRRAQRSRRSCDASGLGRCTGRTATLRQLTDAYVEQYDAAPSTLAFLKDNMRAALASFGDEPIGTLRGRARSRPGGPGCRRASAIARIARCARCSPRRVRWKWIEDNPAALVKNPGAEAGRDRPVRLVGGDRRDRRRARRHVGGALVVFLAGRACGRRRRSAASGATSTLSGACSWSAARSRRAG